MFRNLIMAFCLCAVALSTARAQTITDVQVSGAGFATLVDLNDPPLVSVLTVSGGDVVIDLNPNPSATETVFSLTMLNSTGEDWAGFDLLLSEGGFTDEPVLLTGVPTLSQVSGLNNQSARLEVDVANGGAAFIDLTFTLANTPTSLTVSPLPVPEPLLGLAPAALPLFLRRSRG